MSRRKARQPVQHPETTAPGPKAFPLWIVELAAVLLLAGIPFCLGKYFEFNQPDPYDGGAYAYSAWHIYQGATIWDNEIISAQPATLLVNYIGVALFGFSEMGPEIIQMLLQLGALGLLFYTARRCFGKIAAQLSTAVASIYLSSPFIAKYGNVKEQYMIAFMVMAACCLMLAIQTRKHWLWAAAGAVIVWPFYFKPTGLSIIAAAGFFIVLITVFRYQSLYQLAARLLLLAGGAIAGLCPLVVFLYQKSAPNTVQIFKTTPILLIKLAIVAAGVILAGKVIWAAWQNYQLTSKIKLIPARYWKSGLAAMCLMYALCILMVLTRAWQYDGAQKIHDISGYLKSTPPIGVPYWAVTQSQSFSRKLWKTLGTNDVYLTGSRQYMGFKEQAPMVLRYYKELKLPITLALLSVGTAAARLLLRWRKPQSRIPLAPQDWLVWLLAAWWVLDMAFVWVSPRSYEQYYLPLCASAATLGGYAVWRCMTNWNPASSLVGRILCPAAGLIFVVMVFPIFTGITHSPFSGEPYSMPSRGYVQIWNETKARREGRAVQAWETLADYIKAHSTPQDTIYVWGWYPGIYVQAGRLSSSPKAFESHMHIYTPEVLANEVKAIVNAFEKNPPRFIVDTRKREFPWKVPPLELWPQVPKELAGVYSGFLSTEPQTVQRFETSFSAHLKQQLAAVSPEEYLRFEAMKPLRDYVMQNYKVVGVYGNMHVLFERKPSAEKP